MHTAITGSRRSWRSVVGGASFGALMLLVLSAGAAAQSQTKPDIPATDVVIPANEVLHVHPFWLPFAGSSSSDVVTVFADMKSRLGPEGPHVKLGIAVYLVLSMEDWNVDISNQAAIRGAMVETIGNVDSFIAKARAAGVPVSFSVLTAIREAYDPVQHASENEDIRSMQWYSDNYLAAGFWSHSRYARKARAVQEAYVRELGKILSNRMFLFPETLVAACGDGEVELAWGRSPALYADYSPFAVAEFRDWLRLGGLYATGSTYAGQGYASGARYAGDATPGTDTNGDTHTLNGDLGTSFVTWDLAQFNWSLSDAFVTGDPHVIPKTAYTWPGFGPTAGETIANGFDAPRTPKAIGANAWWDLWVLFKQTMLLHHNQDFAKWMTTSVDPETGATIPAEKWYSYQIPADYLFGGSPTNPNERWYSSMSSWWTADISPYGGLGITAFNLDYVDPPPPSTPFVARTLINVAPKIAARNLRWGIMEWHPGLLPCDSDYPPSLSNCGESANLALLRSEMELVEVYRPTLLQPFAWGLENSAVRGSTFETALREMIARIKDGWRPKTTQNPTNQTASTGGTVTFTAAAIGPPDPTVQWQVSTDGGSTWTDAPGATGTTFSFATVNGDHGKKVRAVFTNVGGSAATTAATVNLYGDVNGSPVSLFFAASKTEASATLVSVTGAQSITVGFTLAGGAWTATTTQTWLQVTSGSGTGPGQFTVAVVNPGNVIGGNTALSGTITITSPTSPNSPTSVPVTLTVDQTGGATGLPPIGLVDTPLQNSTGHVGAIPVTGWAVDDIGIRSVKLYRNCLMFEPQANCAMANGLNVVYLGTATLVGGARPDIELVFPTYPQNQFAGWGYMLLTNMLPHVPNGEMFGGQGSLTLYVLAEDVEGRVRWLGRHFVPGSNPRVTNEDPTYFSMNNDAIGKPFGAIDTPAQGETVSGVMWNFGWTLTIDSNTTAGAGDILMPLTGATQWVYIDGVPVAPLSYYNLCRGTVGSPVPAGLYCNDDVSSIFGNTTPQPLFTTRTSNPTKYRNLDAGRGPQGAYWLDTTLLSNGVHTIVWGVADSAGRGEGIGSRYFTVLNGSADAVTAGSASYGGTAAADAALRAAPAQSRGDARLTDTLRTSSDTVSGRTGFTLTDPYTDVPADEAGVRQVRIPDLGRVDLRLGAVERGYLVANGTLRDLPPGSHLDPATGQFAWAPGVGYLGTYRLAFVRGGEQILVDVTIRPLAATASGESESEIRMAIDVPSQGETLSGSVTVAGWALDPKASIGSGIDAMHVWAQRTDVPSTAPQFLGSALVGGARPDVAKVYGPAFGTAGFSLTTDALAPGQYDITAFVWNRRTARWEDARTVGVTVR